MASHVPPPIGEPRGVSWHFWRAACIGIVIFAGAGAVVIPTFTAKLTQSVTPRESASAPHRQPIAGERPRQEAVRPVMLTLPSAEDWEAIPLGPGEMRGFRIPVGAQSCFSERQPGGTWQKIETGPLAVLTDQLGRQMHIKESGVQYVRALQRMELAYYAVPIDQQCPS